MNSILGAVEWNTWLYQPGLAPVELDFTTSGTDEATALAEAYIDLGGASSPPNYTDYNGWDSNLKVIFHDTLQNNYSQVDIAILTKIDADLDCTDDPNPEVKQRWYPTGIGKDYDPVTEPAHTWISSMGRSKYLNPVYQSLEDSGKHDTGCQWF